MSAHGPCDCCGFVVKVKNLFHNGLLMVYGYCYGMENWREFMK